MTHQADFCDVLLGFCLGSGRTAACRSPSISASFPARPVPFAPELPPAREVLSESRTLRGGGAAGAATVGAAGVDAVRGVLAETQSTIQPLVPYLDTLRWVLIAIALIGIAVTIHARLDDWKRGQR